MRQERNAKRRDRNADLSDSTVAEQTPTRSDTHMQRSSYQELGRGLLVAVERRKILRAPSSLAKACRRQVNNDTWEVARERGISVGMASPPTNPEQHSGEAVQRRTPGCRAKAQVLPSASGDPSKQYICSRKNADDTAARRMRNRSPQQPQATEPYQQLPLARISNERRGRDPRATTNTCRLLRRERASANDWLPSTTPRPGQRQDSPTLVAIPAHMAACYVEGNSAAREPTAAHRRPADLGFRSYLGGGEDRSSCNVACVHRPDYTGYASARTEGDHLGTTLKAGLAAAKC